MADKSVILWDSATGKRLRTLIGHSGPVWDAQFDSTGTRLVTASSDGTVRVWRVSDGLLLGIMHAAATAVRTAVFVPSSGSQILAASDEGAPILTCTTCGSIEEQLEEADRQVSRARGNR